MHESACKVAWRVWEHTLAMHNTHATAQASGCHEKWCWERKGFEGKTVDDPNSTSMYEGGKSELKKKDKNKAKKEAREEKHEEKGHGNNLPNARMSGERSKKLVCLGRVSRKTGHSISWHGLGAGVREVLRGGGREQEGVVSWRGGSGRGGARKPVGGM